MVPGNHTQPAMEIFGTPVTGVMVALDLLVNPVTGQLRHLEEEERRTVVQEDLGLPNLPDQPQDQMQDHKLQQGLPKGQQTIEEVKDRRSKDQGEEIKETTTEIKAPKGQVVAIENVPQPKLVVHKGQKGHKPQGNKLVP